MKTTFVLRKNFPKGKGYFSCKTKNMECLKELIKIGWFAELSELGELLIG